MMKYVVTLLLIIVVAKADAQTPLGAHAAEHDARVTIVAPGAGLRLTGWDKEEVAVFGKADAAAALTIKGNASHVELALRGPVSLEVRLPRNAQVRVDGGNGNVVITGLSGTIETETGRGSLSLEGSVRSINAYAFDGAVDIIGGATEMTRIETVGGDVSVSKANGVLDIKTGSGTIIVRGKVRDAQLFNLSGRTRFEGAVEPRGRLSIESLSGRIELAVPRSLAAEYELTSVSGRVDAAFGRTAPRRTDGANDEVRFTVGDGAARIRAFNLSGHVRLIDQETI